MGTNPINLTSAAMKTQMTTLSVLDRIELQTGLAAAVHGEGKLAEFIAYRLESVKEHLQRDPLTLEDVIDTKEAAAALRLLLIELRDKCEKAAVDVMKSDDKERIDAVNSSFVMASSACALYNATSELINACGMLIAVGCLKLNESGGLFYDNTRLKRELGGVEVGDVQVRVVEYDDHGNITEHKAAPEDIPPEVLKTIENALRAKRKKAEGGDKKEPTNDEK